MGIEIRPQVGKNEASSHPYYPSGHVRRGDMGPVNGRRRIRLGDDNDGSATRSIATRDHEQGRRMDTRDLQRKAEKRRSHPKTNHNVPNNALKTPRSDTQVCGHTTASEHTAPTHDHEKNTGGVEHHMAPTSSTGPRGCTTKRRRRPQHAQMETGNPRAHGRTKKHPDGHSIRRVRWEPQRRPVGR